MTGRFTVKSITAIRELVEGGVSLHFGPVWAFQDSLDEGCLEAVLSN
jgi:hypothetical protein